MTPNILERHSLAIEMLSLGARIKIISEATGLSLKALRKSFVEMHGRSPSCGSQKYNPNFIFKSAAKQQEATVFVFFFRITTEKDFSRRTIASYRRYTTYIKTAVGSKPCFDFTDAWQIAKWSECGLLKLVRCGHCRSAKLITEQDSRQCCVCKK